MRHFQIGAAILLSASLLASAADRVWSGPLGTDFTYQGRLDNSGTPVNGTADFQFKLFGQVSGGTQVGSTVSANSVTVADGTFTVTLDFGATAFDLGDERWLEIAVRSPAGSGTFNTLSPRQEITAAPFSLKARAVDGHSLDAADGTPVDAVSVDNNGQVGIGTTTPSSMLHVKANAPSLILQDTATATNQMGFVSFWNNSAETGWVGFGHLGNPRLSIANVRSGGDIELFPGTGGAVKLSPVAGAFTVATDGRVGIGTTAPSRTLQIRNDAPSLALEDPGSASTQTGYLSFLNATSETAWVGYGTAGSPHFSVVNARAGGNVVLSPGSGGVVQVPVIEITGADLAEKFPTTEKVEPGMVMAINPDDPGKLCLARGAYNRAVAGVVSGANNFSVGAVLGNLPGHQDAPPIALSGRCYVWCDASTAPIAPSDFLTTSDRPGYAMKATDPDRSHGAVLGKAMTGLASGQGLVLVLVNLQ